MNKIYKVVTTVNDEEYETKVIEFEIKKETDNRIYYETCYGMDKKQLDKRKLKEINTNLVNNADSSITYFAFCKFEDIEECKETTKNEVIERLEYLKNRLKKKCEQIGITFE